jgi:hypothetical protein
LPEGLDPGERSGRDRNEGDIALRENEQLLHLARQSAPNMKCWVTSLPV